MKKTIFIAFVFTLAILSSCKKDDNISTPENLVGTNWKTPQDIPDEGAYMYYLYKFKSNTTVEWYKKNQYDPSPNDELVKSGLYSIDSNKITINFGNESLSGIIDGKTMSFVINGKVRTFTKQ